MRTNTFSNNKTLDHLEMTQYFMLPVRCVLSGLDKLVILPSNLQTAKIPTVIFICITVIWKALLIESRKSTIGFEKGFELIWDHI